LYVLCLKNFSSKLQRLRVEFKPKVFSFVALRLYQEPRKSKGYKKLVLTKERGKSEQKYCSFAFGCFWINWLFPHADIFSNADF
jgi:hypothetical protein